MRGRMFWRTAVAGLLAGLPNAWAVPAFRGAEGFGANAQGGRGGDVYKVTTLDGGTIPGSLKYGIDNATGPRTIVFTVAGYIDLASSGYLAIWKPYLTIAGQTAPGDGITIRGRESTVSGNHCIVRHMRFRTGDTYANQDGFAITGGNPVIVDHCSTSWSRDECLSAVYDFTNATIQWCIMAEGLNVDDHSYGSLFDPRVNANLSAHHNLYISNRSRNPRPGTNNDKLLIFDFVNNVMYNWIGNCGYSGGTDEFVDMNYVKNYAVAGPSTSETTEIFSSGANTTRIYQIGNYIDSNRDGTLNGTDRGWNAFSGPEVQMSTPFTVPAVTTTTAAAAFTNVTAGAGARPWSRDAVDTRVVGTVTTTPGKKGAIINYTSDVGGYPALAAGTSPTDTDNDGMPDDWETWFGSNPGVADNNGTLDCHGYTNLEEYLQWLIDRSPIDPPPAQVQADPPFSCTGGPVTLSATVTDGPGLGSSAYRTIYWYTGSCGGTLVGAGNSIEVTPSAPTTYYARAYNTATNSFSCRCSTVSVTVNSSVPADFNHDCCVDELDLALLLPCFGGPETAYPTGCGDKDLDGDGDVDQSDFGPFQRCLSGSTTAVDPDCVN